VAYLNSLIDGCHVNRVPQACIPTRGRIERHGGGTRGGKRIVLGRARHRRARGDQSPAPARRGGGRVAASDGSRSSRDNADSGIVNSSLIPQALACIPDVIPVSLIRCYVKIAPIASRLRLRAAASRDFLLHGKRCPHSRYRATCSCRIRRRREERGRGMLGNPGSGGGFSMDLAFERAGFRGVLHASSS